MKYEFEIIGKPIAKGRPRVTKKGITFTPEKTKEYEIRVKKSFLIKYHHSKPFTGEVKARLQFIFEVPKSYSKKKRAMLLPDEFFDHGMGYTHKPDIDNLAKSILDSLNGLAYTDDSQVTCLLAFKEYGEESKVLVEIEEIGNFIT